MIASFILNCWKPPVNRLALPYKSLAKVNMSHAKQEECSSTFDSVIELGVENSVNKLEEWLAQHMHTASKWTHFEFLCDVETNKAVYFKLSP